MLRGAYWPNWCTQMCTGDLVTNAHLQTHWSLIFRIFHIMLNNSVKSGSSRMSNMHQSTMTCWNILEDCSRRGRTALSKMRPANKLQLYLLSKTGQKSLFFLERYLMRTYILIPSRNKGCLRKSLFFRGLSTRPKPGYHTRPKPGFYNSILGTIL